MPNPLIRNRQLASDTARANLLTNGGFEIWQRGNTFGSPATATFLADRWQAAINGSAVWGGNIVTDSSNNDVGSQYCMSVPAATATLPPANQGASNGLAVYQSIENWRALRGKTVSFSIRVKSSQAGFVQPYINDGVSQYSATGVATSTSYATYTLIATLASNANTCLVGVNFGGGVSQYFLDNAMLVMGSQPADYVPLHPADELNRCLRYYERWDQNADGTAYPAFGATAGDTLHHYFWLPFKSIMAASPSFTNGGVFCLVNAQNTASSPGFSAFSSAQQSRKNLLIMGTTAAAFNAGGAVAWLAYSTNAWMAVEYNP